MRGGDGDSFERVDDPCGRVEVGLARGAAQHGVDEGRGGAEARSVRDVNRLVDGRVRGDAREEAELKQPQPQRATHGRVEFARLPPREVLKRTIEPQLPAQDAERQLVCESAVFRREFFGQVGEQRRGERALILDPAQNLEGGAARGRDAATGAAGLPPHASRCAPARPCRLTEPLARLRARAVDEVARRHALFAFGLQLPDGQGRPAATGHDQLVSPCDDQRPGRRRFV